MILFGAVKTPCSDCIKARNGLHYCTMNCSSRELLEEKPQELCPEGTFKFIRISEPSYRGAMYQRYEHPEHRVFFDVLSMRASKLEGYPDEIIFTVRHRTWLDNPNMQSAQARKAELPE